MFAFGLGWLIRCCEEVEWRAVMLPALLFGGFVLLALTFGSDKAALVVYRIVFAAIIFVGVVSFRQFAKTENAFGRVMYNLGDASFSIYLSHWFVLSATGKVLGTLRLPTAADLPIRLLFIPVSVSVGYGFYISLEKPISRYLKRSVDVSPTRSITALFQRLTRRSVLAATIPARGASKTQIDEHSAPDAKRPA